MKIANQLAKSDHFLPSTSVHMGRFSFKIIAACFLLLFQPVPIFVGDAAADEVSVAPPAINLRLSDAETLENEAVILVKKGQISKAAQHLAKAAKIREQILGPFDASLSGTLLSLSIMLFLEQNVSEAIVALEHASAIKVKLHGDDNKNGISLYPSLAMYYLAGRRYQDAEKIANNTLSVYKRKSFPEDLSVADVLEVLARIEISRSNFSKAEDIATQALGIRERIAGPNDQLIAHTLRVLIIISQSMARYQTIIDIGQRFIKIQKIIGFPKIDPTSDVECILADAYVKLGRQQDAEKLILDNVHDREISYGPTHFTIVGLLEKLAEIYQEERRNGDHEIVCERISKIRTKIATDLKENQKIDTIDDITNSPFLPQCLACVKPTTSCR